MKIGVNIGWKIENKIDEIADELMDVVYFQSSSPFLTPKIDTNKINELINPITNLKKIKYGDR